MADENIQSGDFDEITEMITCRLGFNICIADNTIDFDISKSELNKQKWKYLQHVNHIYLCYGYIRIQNHLNTSFPDELYRLICHFYPLFKVCSIDVETIDNQLTHNVAIKQPVHNWNQLSQICEYPKFYLYGSHTFFKTNSIYLDSGWYKLNTENFEIEKHRFDYANIEQYDANVNMISCDIETNSFTNLKALYVNNGDIILVKSHIWSQVIKRSTFKHNIIDIQTSIDHMLFLSSTGAVFGVGSNEYGQCGIKQQKLHDIEEPIHISALEDHFIKSIHIGQKFSFCVDNEGTLYCFGKNECNVLGLDESKCNIEAVLEPVIHPVFNTKMQKTIINIKCSVCLAMFIDNNEQCYWSGKYKNKQKKK
eukprot:486201_1